MENNAFVLELINLTNDFRVQNNLSPLSVDLDLAEAAQYHSQNMAIADFFSHRDPAGNNSQDRAEDFGYESRFVGENIAVGQSTPQAVFNAWLGSSGHRANILNANWNEIGIGFYFLANDTGSVNFNTYWTQVFGKGTIENPGTTPPSPNGGSSSPVPTGTGTPTSNSALPPGFDPLLYGASYSDLIEVYGSDAAALQAHYLNTGQYEGRSPNLFDAARYLAAYDDLTNAFGNDLQAATIHYIQMGYWEGRSTEGGIFDPAQYLASYDDLINAFGYNLAAARQHYRQNGQRENRQQDLFDEGRYLASNADLIQAFGYDLAAATQHYISHGSKENREFGSFDPSIYLNNYADLQAALGADLNAATRHYIQFGFAEGRTGA
ncbi:MAG: CAP domain-containing protein [Leptolyngbya sp. SIOISBB]|nr:CAP domain-containing protein [Leptolyngbya sp. SIOISBB]